MTPPVPVVPVPRRRLDTGDDEAMFPDEWVTPGSPTVGVLPSGFHLNSQAGASMNGEVSAANPLIDATLAVEPELTPAEFAKLVANSPGGVVPTDKYRIFKSSSFDANTTTVKVTLLFSPSPATYRRLGVRMFFNQSSDRVLINIPGIEKRDPIYGVVGRKDPWGVGITAGTINDLFNTVGLGGKSFQVDVIGGYSTGFRGLNGQINNSVNPLSSSALPGLLDLSKVTMVIYYDAFYIGDEHPPGECTWRALSTLDDATSNTVRVAVYDVTDGTPHRSVHLALHKKLGDRFNASSMRFTLIPIRDSTEAMYGLLFARMLDSALQDNLCTAADLPTPLNNLIASLKALPRGTCLSPIPSGFQRFATSFTPLTTWAATNAADIGKFNDDLKKKVWRERVVPYNLMGWGPPGVDSMLHDGFIPEFGWEFLTG